MAVAAASVLIRDGLTDTHFQAIEKFLEQILKDLQDAATDAQRVTSRLNYFQHRQSYSCLGGDCGKC
jgi:hypothetical protein